MVKRYKGGLMGSTEAITSVSDARGMWGTVQATQARYTGNWPSLLVTETPGSGSGAGAANSFMTVSNVSVTDSNYTVLNDTPYISTSGGYIKVTGRGFVSGCTVYIGGTAATSTTFISSTEVRAVVPAASSNTLMVYVVNPDGSTGIKLNSLIFSGTPTWSTDTTLSSQIGDVAFSIQLSATSDSSVSYSLAAGSSLPAGTSLSSGGVFSGTVTGLSADTTYSFTIVATDAENQDTARAFTVTFSLGEAYFYLTPVLLNGEGNLWIKDSSSNGFTSTVFGDTRPSAFSPYNTSWSGYFDGGADYITVAGDGNLAFGTSDWTIEYFIYLNATTQGLAYDARPSGTTASDYIQIYGCNGVARFSFVVAGATRIQSDNTITPGRWYHFVVSRASGVTRMFVDGVVQTTTYTDSINYLNGTNRPLIGANGGNSVGAEPLNGYISNLRVLKGTGYTSVTVPTSTLTAIANTQLLTLQDNRFKDNSANAYTITKTNDAATKSFGPFPDTDTDTGSGYFDGTTDYLSVPNSTSLQLSGNQFTIEGWFYLTTVGVENYIVVQSTGSPDTQVNWLVRVTNTNVLRTLAMTSGATAVILDGSTTIARNQWYHFACVCDSAGAGATLKSWLNGVYQGASSSFNATNINTNAGATQIGGWSFLASYCFGYISNLRILKGTALYTGTANITVPTSSLTSITNTQLLTLQSRVGENSNRFIDESGLKNIITRTGDVFQGTFSPHSPAGWSSYFGTSNYITVASSADFGYGTGAFTIEFWHFSTTASASAVEVWVQNGTNNCNIQRSSGGFYNVYDGTDRVSTTTVVSNQWNHVAMVCQTGGQTNLYVNGTSVLSWTSSINYSATTFIIAGSTLFPYPGYLSTVRVVKGVAVYTGTFTVPTNTLTLTQSSGSNIAAITTGQTVLLTLQNNRFVDANTTPKTFTISGAPRIQAFSPFRASAAYNPVTHGGSAYFDGSGDYLDFPGPTNLAFGTLDWTIEFWIYFTSVSGDIIIYDSRPASTNGAYPTIYKHADNSFRYYSSTTERIASTTTVVAGTWFHVAVTRAAGTTRMFVNGIVQTTTYTDSTTYLNGASRPRLGDSGVTAGAGFTGYLSGLRVVTGQAVFTGNFTVPTAPPGTSQTVSTNVAAITSNVTLLTNFTQTGIVDYTTRNDLYTAGSGSVRVSNTASKYGTGSISFSGSYQWLFIGPGNTSAYPPLLPIIGDFTVECWIYPTAGDITLMCLNTTSAATAAVRISLNASGTIGLLSSTNGSTFAINATSGNVLTYNAWQHFAVVRNGGNIVVYHNGVAVITSTAVSATTALMAGTESILGAIDFRNNIDFISFYNGYIDDFRVTRIARYTGNFSGSLPTAFLTR